jgi:hypothetical protein
VRDDLSRVDGARGCQAGHDAGQGVVGHGEDQQVGGEPGDPAGGQVTGVGQQPGDPVPARGGGAGDGDHTVAGLGQRGAEGGADPSGADDADGQRGRARPNCARGKARRCAHSVIQS